MDKNKTISALQVKNKQLESLIAKRSAELEELKLELAKVASALDVVQALDVDAITAVLDEGPKPVPIRVHVMNVLSGHEDLTVQQIWERVREAGVDVEKPTVNTTLYNLEKNGQLKRRGIGVYYMPQKA